MPNGTFYIAKQAVLQPDFSYKSGKNRCFGPDYGTLRMQNLHKKSANAI